MERYKQLFNEEVDEFQILNKYSKQLLKHIKHNRSQPAIEAIADFLTIRGIDVTDIDLNYIKTSLL